MIARWLAALAMFGSAAAAAQFAAAVNPPRFEIAVDPGATSRQVLEITQAAPGSTTYRVYTADWTMDADGALAFYEPIQPGSCRPWVAIERHEVTVTMGTRARYRFEVAPAADARPQECRFALMIESKPQDVPTGDSSFPMSGRIAVIVYAAVGGAKPLLESPSAGLDTLDGQPTPTLVVVNRGNATGRLGGVVQGRDASGATVELAPDSIPVLPGQTRRVPLRRYEPPPRVLAGGLTAPPAQPAPPWQWPLAVRGTLQSGSGARLEIDRVFDALGKTPRP